MSRVLIFSPSVYQNYGHSFDYVSGLAEGAAALGLDVHVLGFEGPLLTKTPPHVTPHTRQRGEHHNAKGSTPLKQIRWGFQRIAHMGRLVDFATEKAHDLNCDGVLLEAFEYFSLGRKIAGFKRPLRCVFHDTSFNARQTSVPAAIYKSAVARSAARIVRHCERIFVHGVAMKENLVRSIGLDSLQASRVTPIPYGAPAPDAQRYVKRFEARRTLGIGGEQPVLLAFGTLRKDKAFPLLLRAVSMARHWRLLIAGPEGDMTFGEIDALTRQLGIAERVHCMNRFISTDEQPTFFGAADAVAGIYSTSIRHESGTCQLARAFLKPIVASGPPDLEAYVQDTGVGWAAPCRTPEALAETLSAVETASEDQRRAMQDRISQCAIDRSWPHVCAEVFRGWY